jgi:trehalose 6-phosphate synthase/phosphatase
MRIFIVSNRLSVTVVEGDKLKFKESVDGLVSGLSSYIDSLKGSSLKHEFIWIGWPGF